VERVDVEQIIRSRTGNEAGQPMGIGCSEFKPGGTSTVLSRRAVVSRGAPPQPQASPQDRDRRP
jgi:hypothetical protein